MLLLLSYVFKKCSIVSKWKVKALFSHVQLFASPWTVAHQATQSIEFTRQRILEGGNRSLLQDIPDPGIELRSSILWADFLPSEPWGKLIISKTNIKDCGRWREVNRSARDLKTQRITCSEFLDFLFAFYISDWLPGK